MKKMKEMEQQLTNQGYKYIIGTDEAGRGPLAGPVVVAACHIPLNVKIPKIADSKALNEQEREQLFKLITTNNDITYSVVIIDNHEIDKLNILAASLKGMRDSSLELHKKLITKHGNGVDMILVDGNRDPKFVEPKNIESKTIIKGDGKVYCIAAASIIAKVTRDRLMIEYDKEYPIYNFAQHKGYPTPDHKSLVIKHGPCPIHRCSFNPVRSWCEKNDPSRLPERLKKKNKKTNKIVKNNKLIKSFFKPLKSNNNNNNNDNNQNKKNENKTEKNENNDKMNKKSSKKHKYNELYKELNENWLSIIDKNEFKKEYWTNIINTLNTEKYKINPNKNEIFNAFNICNFNNIKCVFLGQDPSHYDNFSEGLSYSIRKGYSLTQAIKNIFKELENDINFIIPNHGSLMQWGKQGVFLLNTVLTCNNNKAMSHRNIGWQSFTDYIIQLISNKHNGCVFILLGKQAQKKKELIDMTKHKIMESSHPSGFSANRGFLGSKIFSETNKLLKSMNIKPINWKIDKDETLNNDALIEMNKSKNANFGNKKRKKEKYYSDEDSEDEYNIECKLEDDYSDGNIDDNCDDDELWKPNIGKIKEGKNSKIMDFSKSKSNKHTFKSNKKSIVNDDDFLIDSDDD